MAYMSGNSCYYLALDHSRQGIRLLHLLPGKLSDPIYCRLFLRSLDESLTYEALSYTWGAKYDPLYITLAQESVAAPEDSNFELTRNLCTVLQFLRKIFE
ncbi:hypothetical protein F5Y11DRAFT_319982 [Daldinia sp. FL1419]|nr:hypothetical protein F5Y11DRAFT_319982 [Daldinia sp. FL1419]